MIERVREIFEKDRFASLNGAYIEEIGEHYAKCSMKLDSSHQNAAGGVMGGAIFTLADFAFAVAANWENMGTVSLCSNINYLGAAKGKMLIAEAVCKKSGKTTSYYEVSVRDELDNQVAIVTTTGYSRG